MRIIFEIQRKQEYNQVLCVGEKNENKWEAEEATRTCAQYGQGEEYYLYNCQVI